MADNNVSAPTSPPPRVRPVWLALLAVILVLVLGGSVWALTRAQPLSHPSVARPTATATSAPPRVVYAADWSHNAGGWDLPQIVQFKGGQLLFSGNGNANLTIPYQPPVTNYTIEVTMEVDAVSKAARGGTITIAGQDSTGKAQYYAQLLCVGHQGLGCHSGQYTLATFGGQYPSGMQFSDFSIGPYEIPFKVVVAGTHVQFCTRGDCESVSFVQVPTTPLKLVIQDDYLVMKITSVAVSIL
jgi:hypothetical protein